MLLSTCFIANAKAVKFVFHSAANYVFTIHLKTMTLQSEINFQKDIAFAGDEFFTLVVSDSTTWKSQKVLLAS